MWKLHNGALDHVMQLTRSKHGGITEREHQLATAMDPQSRDELLTHHRGGNHGDEEASGEDSPLRQIVRAHV